DYDGYNRRIAHEEITEIMKESKARHKLVIADACHSGSLLAAKVPVQDALTKYYDAFANSEGGIALMMSSKREEYSLEDAGLRSGVFSYFLIEGLKGKADYNGNKILTIEELFDYVYNRVRGYTANAQTPTLSGSFDRSMPVGVIR
ncbi:MAG: caspase family protein, partial [Bacteroidota bacterium]